METVAYYIEQPDVPVTMYTIDANAAVGRFPKEWKLSPWTEAEISAATAPVAKKGKAAPEPAPELTA